MQVRISETRQIVERSGTYDSVTVSANLFHNTANTAIAIGDFSPANVNIKVLLKRNGQQHMIMQDNFLILGTYNTLLRGYHEFLEGENLKYHASGVKAIVQRTATLQFGGPVRVGMGDELITELTVADSAVTSNIDTSVSYVEFFHNKCVGYEHGLYTTISTVVPTGSSNETFNPGDNTTCIAMLNFDKNDLSAPVITSLSLSSDKLDDTWTFAKLVALRPKQYDMLGRKRWGTSLPISASSPSVVEGLPFLPQSFVLYQGFKEGSDLDGARVDVSFNTANVAASQNFICYTRYITDRTTIDKAIKRQAKHTSENIDKLPPATALTSKDPVK